MLNPGESGFVSFSDLFQTAKDFKPKNIDFFKMLTPLGDTG